MQINVSQQLKASIGSRRSYEVSETINIAGGNNVVQGKLGLWLRLVAPGVVDQIVRKNME